MAGGGETDNAADVINGHCGFCQQMLAFVNSPLQQIPHRGDAVGRSEGVGKVEFILLNNLGKII